MTKPAHRWSQAVSRRSDALDLECDVFKQVDPRRIARSLKRSAQRAAQEQSIPLGDVDVELLHQPRRQAAICRTAPAAGVGEGRTARAVRPTEPTPALMAVVLRGRSRPVQNALPQKTARGLPRWPATTTRGRRLRTGTTTDDPKIDALTAQAQDPPARPSVTERVAQPGRVVSAAEISVAVRGAQRAQPSEILAHD